MTDIISPTEGDSRRIAVFRAENIGRVLDDVGKQVVDRETVDIVGRYTVDREVADIAGSSTAGKETAGIADRG